MRERGRSRDWRLRREGERGRERADWRSREERKERGGEREERKEERDRDEGREERERRERTRRGEREEERAREREREVRERIERERKERREKEVPTLESFSFPFFSIEENAAEHTVTTQCSSNENTTRLAWPRYESPPNLITLPDKVMYLNRCAFWKTIFADSRQK